MRLEISAVFTNLDYAKTFIRNFAASIPDIVLLGIGLHESFIGKFLADAKPPGGAIPAIYHSVNKQLRLAQGGQSIGFEVLGYEYGRFHSWLCSNTLTLEVNEQLGIRPGQIDLWTHWLTQQKLLNMQIVMMSQQNQLTGYLG